MNFGNNLVLLNYDAKTRKSLSILVLDKHLHQKVMGKMEATLNSFEPKFQWLCRTN